MSLKIVIDARHIRDFGIGTYIRNLLASLSRLDRDNTYLLPCRAADTEHLGNLPANFRAVHCNHSDTSWTDHIAFPAFLRQFSADVYHIPLNRVPWFMVRPYLVTVHDMGRQILAGTGLRNQLSMTRARRSLMRASKVIAVSMNTRRSVETLLGVPSGRIRQIYNAPDPRFSLQASMAAAGLPPELTPTERGLLERYQVNYPYILYVGNIRPHKNVPRLIEAFAVLRNELAQHPRYSDLRLLIVGDEISKYPAVRTAANQTRTGNAIRFLGHVPFETLQAFYRAARVFAFPSLHEGFGMPPLEAMSCGTPVVTSNTSSLPEVVEDAARLVNPENVFDIAHGIRDVLLDETLRADLIQRGLKQASKFNWDRTGREVLATYLEVAREKG